MFTLKTRSLNFLIILTLAITLLFFSLILPTNFNLAGYQNVSGDTAQHLSGWYAFVNEPWHFPLLKITSLNYPAGASITFTDSIPLFAIPFKLARSFLTKNFNYYALFFIFVVMLQAFSGLVLALATKRAHILGVALFVIGCLTAPIFTTYIGIEDSLTCQGFIILAIAGYFYVRNRVLKKNGLHWFFGTLIFTSLLVHPYISAMVYPFYLLSLFHYKQNSKTSWGKILPVVIVLHLVLAIELWSFGLLMDARPVDGFGMLSMNMLAPFYGGWLAHDAPMYGKGEIASSSYLGLGLIMMLIWTVWQTRNRYRVLFHQYKGLLYVSLFFLVLSIYGNFYFDQHELLSIGVPHFFLTYAFRTNGRFFWPVWYFLMTFAILSLTKKPSQIKSLILSTLIAIQVFDTLGYIHSGRENLFNEFLPSPPFNQSIANLMRANQIIIFYPKMACPNMNAADNALLINTVQLLAAKTGTPINTAYIAHFESNRHCTDDANAFPSLAHKLLVSSTNNPSPTIKILLQVSPDSCKIINQAYYCEYYAQK